jgi:TolA-binding protein/TM2 domain-containing membrane protein YozV
MRSLPVCFCIGSRTTFLALTIVTLAFFSCFSHSIAGSVIEIDANKQFNFAESLFKWGNYRHSIDEYQRFIHFFPEDDRVEHAMFKVGRAYFHSRRFKAAISAFNAVIDKYNNSHLSIQSYLMISESYLNQKAYGSAVITLHNLINITGDIQIKDEAHYRLGWVHIKMAEWNKARSYFAKISASNKEKYRLKALSAELDREKLIPQKNPGLAGALSVIPGAGQLYVGRYQDALIAFLINAGLILAAYESFDNELYALGGLITVLELGFYAGNIYGAVTSAHKYNRKATHQFIEHLKENSKIKFSAGKDAKAFLLTFEVAF